MFQRRDQPLDFVSTANMVLFYSRKRIYFFHEFVRVAQTFDFKHRRHSEVVREARKFLETHIKFLRELGSLAEVREAVAREGVVAVFFGHSGKNWEAFRAVAMDHFDLPLFFLRNPRVQEEVMAFYVGQDLELRNILVGVRCNGIVSFSGTDTCKIVLIDQNPAR